MLRRGTVRERSVAKIDLSRWKNAVGLEQVQKGFCFTQEHDQLFALGWPHVRMITDESADPYKQGLRLLKEPDFDLRISWPKSLASALVRAWSQGALFDMAPGSREFRQNAEEALWNMRTVTEEEVHTVITERMKRTPLWTDERATETFVLLLEALSNTEWVADAIISWLEGLVFEELHELNTHPALITFQLGFLLLRMPKAKADAFKQRMRNVLEGNGNVHPKSDTRPKGQPSHIRSLLMVLIGSAAADKYTDKDLRWYAHGVGDPAHIVMRTTINRLPTLPSARLVFLGGPVVLDTRSIATWPHLSPRDQKWFYEQISPIQHPKMVELMLGGVMQGDQFGALARGWFTEHSAYAKPILDELADADTNAGDLAQTL